MKRTNYEQDVTPINKSLYEIFSAFAEEEGHRRFMFDEDRTYTAADAFTQSIAIANACAKFGIKEGSFVLLRCTRSIDSCLIYLALQFLGAVAVLTDPHLPAQDFLKASGVEMSVDFIISNEDSSLDLAAIGNWKIFKGEESTSLNLHYPVKAEEKNFCTVSDLNALSTIIFTSGSTGKSKAVMLSQYKIVNHFYYHSLFFNYYESDIFVDILPVHHVFGFGVLNIGLFRRLTIFFPKNTSLEYLAQSIEKYHLTWLDGVPSFLLALADYHQKTHFCADSLRGGNFGGAPSTKEQIDFIEAELGMTLLPLYGQSECIAISAGGDWENSATRASTVGKFLPMNTGFILDENGNEVKNGCEGEVCVKGPAVLMGYFGDEAATKEIIDSEGRLHTGDLGWIDQGGYLHISGRKKDIIIRNGNNLSTRKIEDAILALDVVARAVVVSVSHDKFGEVPCALIVVKEGCTASEEDIKQTLMSSLSKIELPERILFAEEIPLTSSGKPDKLKIKDLF